MNMGRVLPILAISLGIIILAVLADTWITRNSGASRFSNLMLDPGPSPTIASDPCLFMKYPSKNSGDSELLERQRRETYGYSSEVSIREALRIFNSEQKCFPHLHEELTDDELIAAIVAGTDYGSEEALRDRRVELRSITQKRTMPKGSLLVSEGSATYSNRFLQGDVFIEGQRVYLFLGLDKNPRDEQRGKRDQVVMIRKKFVKANVK